MIFRLTTHNENEKQPSLPWGRGWAAAALSPADAGRVRGSWSSTFMAAKSLRSPGAFNCSDSSLRSLESHVIPAEEGIHFAEMDPRFRGGDDG
jgi:hypothetical protein